MTKKLSNDKIQEIFQLSSSGKTQWEIWELLGVSRATVNRYLVKLKQWVSDEIVNELKQDDYVKDIDKSELNKNYTILKKKYNDLLDVQWTNNKMEEVRQKTQRHGKDRIEKSKDTKGSESTANIVLSDRHIEEVIDPTTINWINEYNPAIAKERATKVFQNGLKLVDMMAKDENIKNVNFMLLGDFISWYIHPELLENNEMSPTEAILYFKDLVTAWLDMFLRESDYDINVITAFGNHWRTTDKKRISTGWKNSYERMMYVLIAQQYMGNDRIKFKIEKGYHNYYQVYDKMLRNHHWDGIRYQGGVGWITIPLNKAIWQRNKVKKADYDVIWHRHQHRDTGNAIVNWSLIGYWPYAESIKADFEEAKQAFFLLNDKFWKTISAPLFVK